MKIALCSSYTPFADGGDRDVMEWLKAALLKAGHQVELVYLPYSAAAESLLTQMASFRWVDLTSSADRIVCFQPPAYLISHPHKIIWSGCHIREFLDYLSNENGQLSVGEERQAIDDILCSLDAAAFNEAKAVFSHSKSAADCLRRLNGVNSEILYQPVSSPERFRHNGFGDEIVCIARLEQRQRQHLLIEAMRHTRTAVRLRLCGVSSGDKYLQHLEDLIASLGLRDRVRLESRWTDEGQRAELLSDCLAAAYIPSDGWTHGNPVLEASHSSKPVLTTSDVGAGAELIEHDHNGLVVAPDPKALAAAMDQLYVDRNRTREMGLHAAARVNEMNISWSTVLTRLLA